MLIQTYKREKITDMNPQYFSLEIKTHIAHLAINRPEKANSLHLEAWEEMRNVFDYLSTEASVRVVILSGNGKHFCAGMELETLMNLQTGETDCEARTRENLRKFIFNIQDCISAIERCKKPVIAAVDHGCIGGGLNIVSACDMRYCTEDAYFVLKEVDLGIVADIGAIQRLPANINQGFLSEIAFTGRKVFGSEAKSEGLVSGVYSTREELMGQAQKIAEIIASKSPLVIRGLKENIVYQRDHSVHDSLQYIATYNAAHLLSSDLMEAMQSVVMKKPPKFEEG